MDLIRSEWIKLHTVRVTYVLGIIAGAFPLVVVVLVTALSRNPQERVISDFVGLITGTMVLTALLLGVVSALSLTSEYSHGTIRATFAAVPKRHNVLLAKAAVALVTTMIFATIVMLVSYVVGSIIFKSRGAHFTLNGVNTAAMIGLVVLCGLLAMLGYGLGLIIRNSAATVTVLVLWPLLLENIARIVLSAAGVKNPTKWLPYQSAIGMAAPDRADTDPSRLQGGLYLGSVVLAIIIIGVFINERRDA
jgi:ABC-2 type transport system permease protein